MGFCVIRVSRVLASTAFVDLEDFCYGASVLGLVGRAPGGEIEG